MGEVWRARHVALKSPVAIKFLQGSSASSERSRRRFLTEAQVTANLKTRHAVHVFDFGVTEDGLPFLVMELLEGETLDRRIARETRLSPLHTSALMRQAARALDRAHALGIVHRDFKPENVILVADEEGDVEQVKVVDFGIAKLVGELDDPLKNALSSLAQARRRSSPRASDLASGAMGTPHYMAPEQVSDSVHVGPAADIWAFGVVAYECLTGKRPFDDDSIANILRRVMEGVPPAAPSTIAPVPEMFDDWFNVACARNPADRFRDAQTAAIALAVALELPLPAPSSRISHPERPSGPPLVAHPLTVPSPSLERIREPISPLASTLEALPDLTPLPVLVVERPALPPPSPEDAGESALATLEGIAPPAPTQRSSPLVAPPASEPMAPEATPDSEPPSKASPISKAQAALLIALVVLVVRAAVEALSTSPVAHALPRVEQRPLATLALEPVASGTPAPSGDAPAAATPEPVQTSSALPSAMPLPSASAARPPLPPPRRSVLALPPLGI